MPAPRASQLANPVNIERFLTHTTSLGHAEAESYATRPIIRLGFSVAEAEEWMKTRQAQMKWNVKKPRGEDGHKNRKARSVHPYPANGAWHGPPRQFDWMEKWICGHARTFKDERRPDLSPRKRRPNRHQGTVKIECPAFIYLCKIPDEDKVTVEYFWVHEGHDVGTVADMSSSMLPLHVKAWIEQKVEEGLTWATIKPLLWIDTEIMNQINSGNATTLPDSLHVAYMDVYNSLRR
ncbi:hypothetical protein V5O48_018889 [Marasmius crinis-equi]|uniref:Uncharacterized protein n=1 Tax=Marasmius crinis-equi TaxID=585013 RepID=A0ABR3EK08_9AGAR